jgi:hypothetical protein
MEPYPGAFTARDAWTNADNPYRPMPARGRYEYFKAAAAGAGKYFAKRYGGKRKRGRDSNMTKSDAVVYRKGERRRRRNKVTHEPQGNGATFDSIPHNSYIKRRPMNAFAPSHDTINGSFRLAAGVGVQQTTSSPLGTPTDLAVCAAKYLAIAPGALLATGRMFLEKMSSNFTLNNQSNIAIKLVIRDVMARRDIPNIAGIANPESCWNTGLVDENAAGLASDVGVKPYESDIFNQYFKITREYTTDLQPGGNHRHTVTTKPNQFVHQEVINNVTNGFRNLTVWTMFTIVGYPAHDSTTKTQVSTGGVSLDVVFDRTYEFCFASANNVSYTRTNALVSAFTVGEETMNEELGELQNAAGLTATIGAY